MRNTKVITFEYLCLNDFIWPFSIISMFSLADSKIWNIYKIVVKLQAGYN